MKYPTYLLSILIACIIFFLCIIQLPDETPPAFQIPHFDKLVHLLMYLGLTGMLFLERFKQLNNYSWKDLWKFFIKKQKVVFTAISVPVIVSLSAVSLFYGGLIEIIQEFFAPNRAGDIYDFYADAGGVFIAVFILLSVQRIKQKQYQNR